MLWALVLPWTLAGMQIVLGVIILFTVFLGIKQRSLPFALNPFSVFLAMYLLFRVVSSLVSPQPELSLVAVFHTDWVLLTIPFLATNSLSLGDRRRILQTLALSAAVLSIYALFQFFAGIDPYRGRHLAPLGHFYRATGAYDFYLTLAGNQLMIFFLAFAFFRLQTKWQIKRMLYLLATLLTLGSVISTFGRSAWIALAVVLGIAVALTRRRLFGTALGAIVVVVVVLALAVPELQDRILSSFDLTRNQDRLNLWKTALLMISDHPTWGVGPGLFAKKFPQYQVPGHYDATGHPHNDYLNLAATSGLLSLLAWMAMWGAWFYYAIRAFRSSSLPVVDRQILFGIILSITSILVAGFFQCYYTDLENNILWCFLVIMGLQIISQPKQVLSAY